MSLTHSMNQPGQRLSRAAVITFIVLFHIGVFIAFNNGIGHFLKSNPPPDLTVVDVPVDPPQQKAAPIPDVPKAIPEQVLSPPIEEPNIQLDITPIVSESPPSESVDSTATTGSDVPTVDKLSLTSRVDPIYPSSSQRAGNEGTVLLEIVVDINGRAIDVLVTRSSGFEALDMAAVQAVKKWRFNHPSTIVKVHVPITFKLQQRSN